MGRIMSAKPAQRTRVRERRKGHTCAVLHHSLCNKVHGGGGWGPGINWRWGAEGGKDGELSVRGVGFDCVDRAEIGRCARRRWPWRRGRGGRGGACAPWMPVSVWLAPAAARAGRRRSVGVSALCCVVRGGRLAARDALLRAAGFAQAGANVGRRGYCAPPLRSWGIAARSRA